MSFMTKNGSARLALAALALVAPLASAQVVQQYEYEADKIYQVRTGLGITTQVELSPNEKILDYSTGFTSGWELSRRENVFYLKPKNVDVDTNMMIRTATHSYILELKVVATDWQRLEQAKQAGVQYKVTFVYPKDTSFAAASEEVKDESQIDTRLSKDRHYYFDYDYSTRSKQTWIVPNSVYDDGKFTYIKMDLTRFPTGNFPAVFAREKENDEDFLVNTTVEGNTLIVHGTYPFLVVRHGKNVVGLRRNKQK
ncbi:MULTISPECIES: TrbG/VirB9 family P-type conjugative transfer protein [Xanthomonas]|mgnify:CR=1 FL=1|jgi:type IV secretion system protein VirB9|uniref:TrbG/VirB9 family P-type conjugative transfer protein n=1 Tax=Xanthomonas TaxID=338 RepID=UPI0015C8D6DC|nr:MULTISPECIES: TrbG/VirB9 family P-type conjugative transfer protein [Xanthomonas]MBD7920379.1 TrbG/VirB9 family P-type conjugative transfer protein [Xanthomonas surreyensis]NYF19835.1 type IV secretion system protein VirB9 [Xanthomonas sp. JAI131]QNH12276.1 VirB9 protein [Xanthomonas sp. SI]QNH16529.1 VirB9 protein [Xanthomonas sp. SS]